MGANAKRYLYGALRAAGIGVVTYVITEATGEPKIGFLVAGAYGLIGKFLRSTFPKLSWLPIL
ncbi:hypothetical protein LCGC14_2061260 [marine sediment metagenome]|uniref:Uncharacterized protein n=1 Tax=marine sediment metagenome TaxID=412755 RepID=A0A0F9EL41_9ZZZZ